MKLFVVLASLSLAASAFAATSQQNKMKECNTQATGMKGTERSDFMKKCLSNSPMAEAPGASAKATSPQQRMKDCNVQAKGKKGADRKSFMSACLKSDSSAPAAPPAKM